MTPAHLAPTLASEADADAGLGALTTDVPGLGNLPLEALDVAVEARGLLADTTVVQRFRNHHDRPIEVTYVFPLPARAAVVSFTARLGERVVSGLLKERGEARATYDRALTEGRRAAIVEEDRPEVFTCRVGNLGPGETAEITLALVAPLPHEDGAVTVRVPLVVAPRYVPGAPLDGEAVGQGWGPDTDATPDGSRVTPPVLLPGFPEPIDLRLSVDVDPGGLPVGELTSSLHAVTRSQGDGGVVRVEVEPGERVDRDFILRYGLTVPDVEAAATVTPDSATAPDATPDTDAARTTAVPGRRPSGPGDATVAVTVIGPPPEPGTAPRDVVVLLDRSGSMGGWKIVAARRAAGRLVDALGPDDRFAIHAFDHDHDAFDGGALVEATDRNRWRAGEWAARLDARGGTELLGALQRAFATLAAAPRRPDARTRAQLIVLVTDGQVANEGQILGALAGVPVHAVGVDRAVNAGFLDRIARASGGRADLVESEDRLDEVLTALRRRLAPPLLTDLTVEGAGIDPASMAAPTSLDVHAGVPLVMFARRSHADADADAPVTVRGRRRDGSTWTRVITPGTGPRAVRSLWGRARLRALEDDYEAHGGDTGPIVDLSLATGVLSRFTAFVAESPDGPVGADGGPMSVVQPVSYPSGWSPDALVAPAMAAPASFTTAPPHLAFGPDEDSGFAGASPEDGFLGIGPTRQWHQQEQAAPSRPGRRVLRPARGPLDGGGRPAAPPRGGAFWSKRPSASSTPPADGSLAARVRDLLRAIDHPAADLAALAVRARALVVEARDAGDTALARALDDLAVALGAEDPVEVSAACVRVKRGLVPTVT